MFCASVLCECVCVLVIVKKRGDKGEARVPKGKNGIVKKVVMSQGEKKKGKGERTTAGTRGSSASHKNMKKKRDGLEKGDGRVEKALDILFQTM